MLSSSSTTNTRPVACFISASLSQKLWGRTRDKTGSVCHVYPWWVPSASSSPCICIYILFSTGILVGGLDVEHSPQPMNVTSRFTLVFTLMFALVLLSLSAWQMQQFLSLQIRENDDEVAMLARTVAAAGSDLWRLGGKPIARDFIARSNSARDRAQFTVSQPSEQALTNIDAAGGVLLVRTERDIVAQAPISGPDDEFLLLEVRRSLALESAYTRGVLSQQAVVMLLFIAGASLLTWLLSRRVFSDPLARLTAQARAIARGDFSSRLALPTLREFRVLAREFNLMVDALDQARDALTHQHDQHAELTDQLRHADRLSSIGKLAASIGHELGTPLNVVSGHASMILMDPTASAKSREHATKIADRVQHITQLLRQMMTYARGEGVKHSSVRVDEALANAISLVAPLAKRSHVEIVRTGTVAAGVRLDAQRILQVLTNLIVNAIHAMPNGGTIRVGASLVSDVTAPPDATTAPQYLRIRVEDEGIGMTEEQAKHAFEPFFTTKEPGRGTGLGLPICDGIVRDHGGWMTLQSAPQQGTSVDCFFPVPAEA